MSFSDYLELELLDHITKVGAFTMPASLYVAVGNGADDTGITEPTTGDYARKKHMTWKTAAGGSTVNSNAITFDQATGNWLNASKLYYFAIFDASSAGNMLLWGEMSSPRKAIISGDTLKFDNGALKVKLD